MTDQTTVTAPSALKKQYTIWQWEKNSRVKYPSTAIATFVALCLVFIGSLILAIFMLTHFDPKSVISVISYFVSVFSLIGIAVTAGNFKGHSTWQFAFIRDENGDVYLVDYTDEKMANALHYYDLIPDDYKHGVRVYHSAPLQVAGAVYYLGIFPKMCKQCLNTIRDSKVDVRVADSCHKYGYKIISVPEIHKKSYFTFIRLIVLKDGKEVELENLFDNCYEGYDEMVEYLSNHFEHDDPLKREKKSDKIRALLFSGIAVFLISIALFAINSGFKILFINIIAFVGVLLGFGLIMAFFSEKSKR